MGQRRNIEDIPFFHCVHITIFERDRCTAGYHHTQMPCCKPDSSGPSNSICPLGYSLYTIPLKGILVFGRYLRPSLSMSSRTTKLLIFTRTSAIVKVRIEHKMIENFTFAELNNYNCSKVIVIIGGMSQ